MQSKRPIILMAILLFVLLGYLVTPLWEGYFAKTEQKPSAELPLPGENSISGLKIEEDHGRWFVNFDYFYTGNPAYASLDIKLYPSLEVTEDESKNSGDGRVGGGLTAKRGANHARMEIAYPYGQPVTKRIVVELRSLDIDASRRAGPRQLNFVVAAKQYVAYELTWPDPETWGISHKYGDKKVDDIYAEIVQMVDAGDEWSLTQARRLIEYLLGRDSKFEPAYIELARVLMKSNWGAEGLHQAEGALSTALQMNPDSLNAKILMGYVYAHQGRFKAAEELFVAVAKSEPPNLWLWANWGELLLKQGKLDLAVQKYQEALKRPVTQKTYGRARQDAYRHLFSIYWGKKDIEAIGALHEQRVAEYGAGSCFGAEYAMFVIQQKGDADKGIELARQAVAGQCNNEAGKSALALGYYLAWLKGDEQQRNDYMNKARMFMPMGAKTLYLLAASEKTAAVAQQLIKSGESLEQRDNEKWNALAYAVAERDYATAKRLLRLGARAEHPVGPFDMPVALLPVVKADIEGVKLFQQSGVNYAVLKFRGITALDHAKQIGNRELINLLTPKTHTL